MKYKNEFKYEIKSLEFFIMKGAHDEIWTVPFLDGSS